jgi:hypothetical protein
LLKQKPTGVWNKIYAFGNCIQALVIILGIEKDKIHDLMGYKFLRYQTEIAGMPVELVKSTTKLDTQQPCQNINTK